MRPLTILGALGAGIAVASGLWLAGADSWISDPAGGLSPHASKRSPLSASAAAPIAIDPLFVAAPEPGVRLVGISRIGAQASALLSINQAPPQRAAKGQSISGVTLLDVGSGQVVVETSGGRRVVSLGETSQAAPSAPANTSAKP